MEAIHENNIKHTWTEYKSIEDVGKRKKRNPTKVKCPKCHRTGRAASFRRDMTKPEFVSYYMAHDDGTRCHIIKPEDRDKLLKKLGRYIETSTVQIMRSKFYNVMRKKINPIKMECPKCHKPGTITSFHDRNDKLRYYIRHGYEGKKAIRCYMNKKTDIEKVLDVLQPKLVTR